MDTHGFDRHDHGTCIASAMATVEAHCADAGLKLTPVRRRVLELLLAQHKAMGAYEVLDVLREEGLGSQPPVAYRALDFLVKHGFVHKIERLNAFVACCHPGERHSPIFLICRNCNLVGEAHAPSSTSVLGEALSGTDFLLERCVIEAEGLCQNCRGAA